MYLYLHKYLVLNKRLSIPDLGSFVIESNTAKLDNANGFLFAPAPAIKFKQEQTPPSDKFLFDFISDEIGVDQMTAIKQFHDYVYKIKTALTTPEGAVITGIGTLRKEENGYILFTPEKNLLDLLPQVKVTDGIAQFNNDVEKNNLDEERNFTQQEEEDIRELLGKESQNKSGDNWWVYAIILLMIAIGALLFYYV
ncbi:hypothetical protein [Sediminibacterium sp.]|uniref:hypothetical protein n=1 Tax=Sediminibacterium sp. TaxID=1917865 RepID=UPI003F7292E4